MTPEISAGGDLYVQAPLIGGTGAFSVFVLHQIPSDPPELGSYPSWGMEAPLRPDGEPRDRFWNGKTLFTCLAACGEAYARSSSPADVALVYRREPELAGSWAEVHGAGWPQGDPFGEQVHSMNAGRRSQEQAQELVRREIEFDVVDPRYAEPGWEGRYLHVLEPGDPVPDDPSLRHATTALDQALLATGFAYDHKSNPANNYLHLERFQRAAQAVRRAGVASLDLACVAAGRFDGFWELKLKPWDVAAGVLLVEEAGGRVSDYAGLPMHLAKGEILASNGRLHAAMQELLH